MTGATSGAVLRFLSDQSHLGNKMLIERISGTPQFPEQFAFGADTVSGVDFDNYYGFRFELPWESTATATIPEDSQNVTFASPPTDLDKVQPGDMFEALTGPMVTNPYRARIRSVDVPGSTAVLQVPQPFAGVAADEWKVTPNIGSEIGISFSQGGRVRAGSRYISIYLTAADPNPLDYGVMPGDLIRCTTTPGGATTDGTGQAFVRIKDIILSPASQTTFLFEIEDEDVDKLSDGGVGGGGLPWEVAVMHQRVQVARDGTGALANRDGDLYDAGIGHERWLIKGPAYWHIPGENYGTPYRGGAVGIPVAGVTNSGLTGKTLTLTLKRNGDRIARETITFASDPASLEAVATAFQTAITAAGFDWAEAYSALYPPALVVATTAKTTYSDPALSAYDAVGPEVTLEIEGEAWEALKLGNAAPSTGNVSQEYQASHYDEHNRHVASAVDTWLFDWRGVTVLMYARAELGSGDASTGVNALYNFDNNQDHFANSKAPMTGTFSGDTRPTLNLHAEDDYSFHGAGIDALQVSAGQRVNAYAKHSGEVGTRQLRQHLTSADGTLRGVDAFGSYGARLPLLYSGPIS
ncbi:MAG: hypothetical protein KDB07_02720, partial [Planctomycetes bacterium]|nr:hypothetical protein [Planctomycetota bacterium]